MQDSNDDNGWGDIMPSLEETLEKLPELRPFVQGVGSLRTDPNINDLKSSGKPGPPTSRGIAPEPYNPPFPIEPARKVRPKPNLEGLYTPRPLRYASVGSEDNESPSFRKPDSNPIPLKKGSYRAAMAEARSLKAEKESQLQFTAANESESDREFRHRRVLNSTALDRHNKLNATRPTRAEATVASDKAQRVVKGSNVKPVSLAERSLPLGVTPALANKNGYMGQKSYSISDSSESEEYTHERYYGPKRNVSLPANKASQIAASPVARHREHSHHEEPTSPVPPVTPITHTTPQEATGNSRPRRQAAILATQRARSQIDDPFPGFFAPRRVNRRTAEQKALMPRLPTKKLVLQVGETASEDDEISRPPIPVRRIGQKTQLFYAMESIDPEEE
ncbi:hypothetical protein L873DRAFT_1791733 [Choiromyces venosus 120613-1]|uniref:Uncharacterized protein n=1 Tax=Choiromyces venosus 120613-1 TaxID=1336337 RepID=A0A3N4JR28_9PEZI|nr:hypothetical protein L873DRAFT_1791733 [Choiromyces venosus 120613-1]